LYENYEIFFKELNLKKNNYNKMGNVLLNCSPDGVLLSSVKLNDPTGTCVRGIVYYVAVGNGVVKNTIIISSDGNKWTGLGNTIFTTANGITYNNLQKTWVAVGTGKNSIATSNDGYNWTGLGIDIFTGGNNVKYANNLFVAVGTGNNSVATSTDGKIWTGLGKTIFTTGNKVSYGNGLWIAVGFNYNSCIATSSNGNEWTLINILFDSNGGRGIYYGNGLWIAVGSNIIAKSTNGGTWTYTTTNIFSNCYDICYSSNLWVIVGGGNNHIATSSDGNVWTGLGNTFFQYNGKSVNYLNDLWFVGGQNNIMDNTKNTIFTSTNGNDWIPKVDYNILNLCSGIEYAKPLLPQFIVTGTDVSSIATIFTTISTNEWKIAQTSTISYRNGVAYGKDGSGNGLFVAVGVASKVFISSIDGTNWTEISNTDINDNSVFTSSGKGIAFGKDNLGNNLWVAVGNGQNSFASSINGTEWTGRGGYNVTAVRQSNGTYTYIQPIFDTGANEVVYGKDDVGNGLWVAVGGSSNNCIASSTNGTTWTGRGGITILSNGFSVAFGKDATGNNLWVVVGKGKYNFATSTNGITWIGRGNSGTSAIFYECNGVAYGNNLWVVVGSGSSDSFATSTDGIIWTPRGGKTNLFDWRGNNVKYGKDNLGNGLWIAGGKGTSHKIATSINGITWNGRGGITIFDNECVKILAL
jgi:hypothetical protein